ncbi:MAG TPA: hypothetical protein DD412_06710 [Holosporales bacterium]|nr:hypothetical protein [Holosporales bacterium]
MNIQEHEKKTVETIKKEMGFSGLNEEDFKIESKTQIENIIEIVEGDFVAEINASEPFDMNVMIQVDCVTLDYKESIDGLDSCCVFIKESYENYLTNLK